MGRTDRAPAPDLARLEVFQHLFASVAEEMGVALMRSAFSPNIKERRDFSCALFGPDGEMVAQAAHLPVHLGSSPLSLAAARAALELGPGDVALLNDPFEGGTHLPDLTLVSPVFLEGAREPQFWCVSRAHHADVGGFHPGSMAPVPDIHGEGLRIPPVRLVKQGEVVEDVLRLFLANVRVPGERRADLFAQLAAHDVGARRLARMAEEHGAAALVTRGAQLVDWTERLAARALESLPEGRFAFEDGLELPGGDSARIRVSLERQGARLAVDFRDTDDQHAGPVNTVRAVVESGVFYVLRLLLPPGSPTNAGLLRGVDIATRLGSLVDAQYPAPVAAGNVETSQRVVDVLLGALAQALPERIPAASAGTMSNLTFGAPDGSFAYYETLPGGAGGGPEGPGAHALQTHMTNTRNTPIEALERELPVRVLASTVRRGTGGEGRARGGDGILRRLRFEVPVRVGWIAERQRSGPWGLEGGGPGMAGGAVWSEREGGRRRPLDGKAALDLPAGAVLEVHTPGGGGHGRRAGSEPG